jgi:hypothetical protein
MIELSQNTCSYFVSLLSWTMQFLIDIRTMSRTHDDPYTSGGKHARKDTRPVFTTPPDATGYEYTLFTQFCQELMPSTLPQIFFRPELSGLAMGFSRQPAAAERFKTDAHAVL